MAARNRAHIISLRDPQPPILGRAPLPPPLPHHPHPHHPLDDPRRPLLPHPPSHHHVLLLEERLNAQFREILVLLTDNQRLAATHVALAQEVNIARHELRVAAAKAASEEAEKDREVREVYERSLRVEADLRGVEMKRAELSQVKADVEELVAAREELVVRLQGIKAELARARAEVQQVPALRAELEKMQVEIQKGRAAVEYEKKAHTDNLEQSQVMEKNMAMMARELEKLQAELANAEKRARAAAAAATTANPVVSGSGYTGSYGNPEMAYGGNVYANVYGMQQAQSASGSQYASGSGSHGLYEMQQHNSGHR